MRVINLLIMPFKRVIICARWFTRRSFSVYYDSGVKQALNDTCKSFSLFILAVVYTLYYLYSRAIYTLYSFWSGLMKRKFWIDNWIKKWTPKTCNFVLTRKQEMNRITIYMFWNLILSYWTLILSSCVQLFEIELIALLSDTYAAFFTGGDQWKSWQDHVLPFCWILEVNQPLARVAW